MSNAHPSRRTTRNKRRTTRNKRRTTRNKRCTRNGAAFLILVVLVLLVVLGATQTLIRSEMTARRSETDRLRLRSMSAAIDAAQRQDIAPDQPLRLPMDESSNQSIEVTVNESESRVSARWLKAEKVVVEMHRDIVKKVESNQ